MAHGIYLCLRHGDRIGIGAWFPHTKLLNHLIGVSKPHRNQLSSHKGSVQPVLCILFQYVFALKPFLSRSLILIFVVNARPGEAYPDRRGSISL